MLDHKLQPEAVSYLPQDHAESTSIPGYKPLLLVSADTQTLLYRSLREKDGTRHLVRTHKAGHPCAGFRALIQRKYEMLGNLPVAGILRPFGLVESAAGPALILEDFNGITLEDILSVDCMGTKTFLQLGGRICTILSQIHENKIIHGDLNPRNILVNSKTGEVKITGFRRALYFSEALCPACDIDCLKGNQTYISPEQTGRINQPLDCRSDLYSLGAVFYHILAGAPPFLSDDPLELAYQHIAKEPELPESVNSEIPATISGIVMKLLSKSPCDRYQSAQGLKGDLQECLALLESSGGFTGFAPGRHDASSTFCLPKKLYGRQQEIASLMGSFGRIASGAREMLLISGYSGIGKSSLVHEVRSRIAMQNGYFITGKFDQFKVDIPFSALIEAFRGMVRQILCESDKMITTRKERLQDELGRNLRVIIDVIPEVALITGEQPPLPELPPQEAENRFHSACNKFIRVLSGDTHPLVIFLDDLQWVDPASLKLLLSIVTDPALTHLLVIGAFRDNEMEPSNILTYTLNEIFQRGTIINRIIMTPLSEQHVSQLVADTMHCDLDKARPLAEMVMQKTGGSPFFARQFLQNLHEESLLAFDFGSGAWQWNLARIQAKGITDNVVELIAGNLLRLSPGTVELLTQAACIGNTFSLETVAIVLGKEQIELSTNLMEALHEGAITFKQRGMPEQTGQIDLQNQAKSFTFQHDRIQQAAYSLIPDEKKKATHLKIGRQILKTGILHEHLFEIVGHLNRAQELIENKDEKAELARLNLEAGMKAKKDTAYESAHTYFSTGVALLSPDCWSIAYDLAYPLYLELAECEYLVASFEQAEYFYDLLLHKVRTQLDTSRVYGSMVGMYEKMERPADAVACGMMGLKQLGVNIGTVPVPVRMILTLTAVKWRMRGMRPSDLLQLPAMTDQKMLAAMKILMSLIASAYFMGKYQISLIILTMVRLSLHYGVSVESALAFASFGVIEGSILGNYRQGHDIGESAVVLSRRFTDNRLQAKTEYVFAGYINHWCRHASTSIPLLADAYELALESGEYMYVTYCSSSMTLLAVHAAELLDTVKAMAIKFESVCRNINNQNQIEIHRIVKQAVKNLKGSTEYPTSFTDASYNEETHVAFLRKHPVKIPLHDYYLLKAQSLYIYGDFSCAFDLALKSEREIFTYQLGTMTCAESSFFLALSAAALYPTASITQKTGYLSILRRNRKRMKKWAENCPENFLHRHLLIEAEICRIKRNHQKAAALYAQAVQSAREQRYIQIEALANECAARFYIERGDGGTCRKYLSEAHRCYTEWGASGKVRILEERYPGLARTEVTPPADFR